MNNSFKDVVALTVCILFLTSLFGCEYVTASSLSDVDKLYTDLLTGYNKEVRPALNTYHPVYVNVTFYLVGIHEFDEVTGKFSVTCFMIITWIDSRLTWAMTDYNYTFTIMFPQSKVWKPELILINPYEKIDSLGGDFMRVRAYTNGVSVWSPGDVIASSCSIDVTYYPFDTQTCTMILTVWGTGSSEVLLVSPNDFADLSFFSEHGTWELVKAESSADSNDAMSFYRMSITIRRRPLFFVVNVVLPIVFMACLNILVFLLPVESGERVSYAITVLLATAVFLTLVGDNLPKTSQPMSILCYFLMTDLVMSAVICVATIVGLKIHHIDPERNKVPTMLSKLVQRIVCRSDRKQAHRDIDVQPVPTIEPEVVNKTKPSSRRISVRPFKTPKSVAPEHCYIEHFGGEQNRDETNVENVDDVENYPITWTTVCRAFDRVMLLFSSLWVLAMCSAFFAVVVIGSQSS